MKTFGLIWPDGTKELSTIALKDDGSHQIESIRPHPVPENWEAPRVLPLIKIPKPQEGAWEPNVVWFEDRVERQWVAGTPAPVPTITAEQAVSQYFSPYQTLALQRFEMALLQAGKPLGPKMSACKQWLESVMLAWAMNPTPAPAASYGSPAATFEEASAEAVTDLAG
jgi:hypothetical protein